jgi:hypothetical protein
LYLHFILLEEWNNSAVAVVFAIVLIPALIISLILNAILKTIPPAQQFIAAKKKGNIFVYALLQLLIFLLSIGILFLMVTIYKMAG